MISKDLQSFNINSSFRKPHPFRFSSKPEVKVSYSPFDLGSFIFYGGKRHYHMIISLSYGGAMTGKVPGTFKVSFKDSFIYPDIIFFKPRKKSGTKIETYMRIIINHPDYSASFVKKSGSRVWSIALRCYSFIPIGKRRRRSLYFYPL